MGLHEVLEENGEGGRNDREKGSKRERYWKVLCPSVYEIERNR